MTGILLFCRRCGKQVYSSEVRDGLCLDCRVDAALADLRDEDVRLRRKLERYRARGANVDSINRQHERLMQRMAERIMGLVPDQKVAAEQLERTLKKARNSRYDIRSPR